MFKQLTRKLRRRAKRQKIADYLERLEDRVHELDQQEDNIASERLYISLHVPRLREQLRKMDLGQAELRVAANMTPQQIEQMKKDLFPNDGKVRNVIVTNSVSGLAADALGRALDRSARPDIAQPQPGRTA